MDFGSRPFKRRGVGVIGLNEPVNGMAELARRGEAGPPQGSPPQQAEPGLHLVEPGSVGGGKMKVHVGIAFQPDNDCREAMLEDVILIEAALATDMTVASLDETVRGHYRRAFNSVQALKNVVWVNPDKEDEKPIIWLREGANPDEERKLGYRLALA